MKHFSILFFLVLIINTAHADPTLLWGITAATENASCDVANCNVDISDFGASIGYQRSFGKILLGGSADFSNTGPGGSLFTGVEFGENSSLKVGVGKASLDLSVITQIAMTSSGPTMFSNTVDEIVPDERKAEAEPETVFLEYSYRLSGKPYSFSIRYSAFDETVPFHDTNIVTQDVGGGATFTRNVGFENEADIDGSIITVTFNFLL